MLRRSFARLISVEQYSQPHAVGYRGCIRIPLVGVIAFVNLDGSLLTDWK